MTRWLAAVAALSLTMTPLTLSAQSAATPGSGSKVEPGQGSTPSGTPPMSRPAESAKAATPGSGSKVEATSGSTGSTETPPSSAGSADTGSRDITPGAGAPPTGTQYSTEKALSATPGPDKQGDSAGPAVPPK